MSLTSLALKNTGSATVTPGQIISFGTLFPGPSPLVLEYIHVGHL
jgi:hypothetical protein